MGLKLITASTTLPVTLEDIRDYCRIDVTGDDATLQALIQAAVSALDGRNGFLGRCLEAQTWELVLHCFPSREIVLALGPIVSITSVKYDDTGGAEQTVATGNYQLDNLSHFDGLVIPVSGFSWPGTANAANAVWVRIIAGTGTPEAVKQSIRDMIANRFENRGDGKMLTPGIVADLAPFRRPVVLL